MTQLRSTINSTTVGKQVLHVARKQLRGHHLSAIFEHDHWWVMCSDCGAQWDAYDAVRDGTDTFDFEQVAEGDESCN